MKPKMGLSNVTARNMMQISYLLASLRKFKGHTGLLERNTT
jgi:hypothetical protein